MAHMSAVMTREDISQRLGEIRTELASLQETWAGRAFPPEERKTWNELNEERDNLEALDAELEARERVVERDSQDPERRENGADFYVGTSRGSTRGGDIWDTTTIRSSAFDPMVASREIGERAKRALDQARFFQDGVDEARAKEHINKLLEREQMQAEAMASGTMFLDQPNELGRRMLITGSPVYQRAWAKYVSKGLHALSPDEARAMSVGTGSAGGFAVVYTLDPTIIPTSNLSVNPFRSVCRVETISGTNEWRGVTSAGGSATRVAEATEASDGSVTLAQPAVVVQRVQYFVPVSIELTQDLPSIQASLARLIQDAKDDEEATSFTTGNGTAPNAQGIITGATTTVAAGGVATFAIADLYALEQALGPRFRPRSTALMNRFVANKVRQFDTAGGSGVWSLDPLPGNLQAGLENNAQAGGSFGAKLLGYPAYEDSAMAAALTTGSKIMVLGDFSYFIIVDRIGMDIEVIPHLFGSSNRFPTGQRGIYAYWRNNSKVLDANAFRVLVTG